MQITPRQLGRLQTLYSQYARHECIGVDRDSRILWATERLRKPVSSFKALTMDDARFMIDSLQGQLGVKAPLKKRLPRDQARRAGLDGRNDGKEFKDAPQMATPQDVERIKGMLALLGWSVEIYATFLDSSRSPIQRADKQVRTTSDANKVYWALKRIAQSKGLWKRQP